MLDIHTLVKLVELILWSWPDGSHGAMTLVPGWSWDSKPGSRWPRRTSTKGGAARPADANVAMSAYPESYLVKCCTPLTDTHTQVFCTAGKHCGKRGHGMQCCMVLPCKDPSCSHNTPP